MNRKSFDKIGSSLIGIFFIVLGLTFVIIGIQFDIRTNLFSLGVIIGAVFTVGGFIVLQLCQIAIKLKIYDE